ncbi:MerR family transcriptional regulator [Streptomyces sp. NBC_00029]|uniref:MerR family transcriptional regulator n=1 Tax=Streptomyces sp. NBC_00029 TaxID=2903613 RepID=UPI003247EE19
MPDTSPRVTTGSVARRLGISPTTLRSWDRRYGMGPAAREDGRHRRWTREDIAMLEDMCRLTTSGVPPSEAAGVALSQAGRPRPARTRPASSVVPRPVRAPGSSEGLPLGDVRHAFRGLARAAVRLDSLTMDEQLAELMATQGLVIAWEEVMAPTLHAVGRKWESSDDRYIEVEHLLSWHISTALRRFTGNAPPPARDAPPVLMACVPDEQHTLPLEALAAGLAERGLPTRILGAAVPAEALNASVRRVGPSAVVLWSQARRTADHNLARHIVGTGFGVRGARTHPLVLLAGPGWRNSPLTAGMMRPGGLREALEVLARHCAAVSAPLTAPASADGRQLTGSPTAVRSRAQHRTGTARRPGARSAPASDRLST